MDYIRLAKAIGITVGIFAGIGGVFLLIAKFPGYFIIGAIVLVVFFMVLWVYATLGEA